MANNPIASQLEETLATSHGLTEPELREFIMLLSRASDRLSTHETDRYAQCTEYLLDAAKCLKQV